MPLQWSNQFWQSLEEDAGKRCSECGADQAVCVPVVMCDERKKKNKKKKKQKKKKQKKKTGVRWLRRRPRIGSGFVCDRS